MNAKRTKNSRQGAALLVVLFIVMVITILSLGFLSRSDVELACGQNMILRTQMDYLAESGLEHARGLILNPQDVDSEYWPGAIEQQLVAASDDYYDIVIVRDNSDPTNRCNYIIECNSYRLKNDESIGRSSLRANLRLDPCVAFWAGAGTIIGKRITVNGDIYCGGNISGNGNIDGDVFARGAITGLTITGQKNEFIAQPPVEWPGIDVNDFSSTYFIGSATCQRDIVDSNVHLEGNFNPTEINPAGVRYRSGNLELAGGVNIKGLLVVNGTLRITGENNIINAVKNFPALLVSDEVVVEDGGELSIEGLAQIGQRIVIDPNAANVDVDVLGSLFIANGGIDGAISNTVSVDITAAPAIASIQIWPAINTTRRWRPAAGAFYRSIERN